MFNAKGSPTNIALTTLFSVLSFSLSSEVFAAALFDSGIPGGWTTQGNSGTSGANGVVPLAPSGGSQYGWVSTASGVSGVGLGLGSETTGSTLTSTLFSANAGDNLHFAFNFVTSDGAGFADYGWAQLLDATLSPVVTLFTARTTPSGNSVPGFNMPPIGAAVTPSTVLIIPGGPLWSPLGGSTGTCYSTGCGYSGWIASDYTIASSGNYYLKFGTVNWADSAYQTGLAFDGITVGGVAIGGDGNSVPEPASLALLGIGLAGLGVMRRRSQV